MKKTETIPALRSFILFNEINKSKKLLIVETILCIVCLGLVIHLYIKVNELTEQLVASMF